ncbi:type VI secretion system protein ImpJ [Nitrosospira briensis]|uniref:Type VI secretion system protein ImpJ n=1 Tax=Nitrosospira briensis TaxID=35799 RepID=A0A1I5CNJ4_9PROT|nr:type VI secretion system baseplate subunit TssK [Nitrosospira briensis]SFN88436.1 type VI secretion system protein ImpJ [Nitrosospira briensis]
MSWNNKVVWSEGLFLQPQHFQQHDRYLERLVEGRAAPLLGYSWGFHSMELNRTASALGKVQLTTARGIFPDGTPFDFPGEDTSPAPLDIDEDIRNELIVLALPMRRPGMDETDQADAQANTLARFSVEEREIADSNSSSGNSTSLQVGQLRLRLMRKRDATDAYTTLDVAQVTERRPDNQLILQKEFIPPMLCAGDDLILSGYVSELQGLLHQRGETLAARVAQPGRGGVAEVADFLMLQTVNRYEPVFAHFLAHSLLHPERLFSICLSLAGDLATFGAANRRPPRYPEYQHDNLAQCFFPLIADIRSVLTMILDQNAVSIELQNRTQGYWLAKIPNVELFKTSSFILAVGAQVAAETLRNRFPAQVKIGSVERIRDLVNLALPGIPLNPLPVAPRQIPFHAGFSYFELERGGEMWKQLERSAGLAMHIAGEFPGLTLEFWAIRG